MITPPKVITGLGLFYPSKYEIYGYHRASLATFSWCQIAHVIGVLLPKSKYSIVWKREKVIAKEYYFLH